MEIHFGQPATKKAKPKGRGGAKGRNKLVGVRQRPSGRWVAEIKDTTQKIRMWLGTFDTAEDAARAYDEAACLLRGSNARTNFATRVSPRSPLASRIRALLADTTKPRNDLTSSSNTCNASSTTTLADSSDQPVDEAYKPYVPEFSSPDSGLSWPIGAETVDPEFFEFERMRVERQISASLYAMNGVHEYMETVHDPSEPLWDLPPLCSLLYYESDLCKMYNPVVSTV